ncbi:Nn.00g053380.m01.CDS01 [Neocucurbitaria sp. VM-36]
MHKGTVTAERVYVKKWEGKRFLSLGKKRGDEGTAVTSKPKSGSRKKYQSLHEQKTLQSRSAVDDIATDSLRSRDRFLGAGPKEADSSFVVPALGLQLRVSGSKDHTKERHDDLLDSGIPRGLSRSLTYLHAAGRSTEIRTISEKSTQLIRIISFAQAIDTLRFGDATHLPIESVIAGFWQHYHDTATVWNREPRSIKASSNHYFYLLTYLSIRATPNQLSSSNSDFIFKAFIDLQKSSNVWTALSMTILTSRSQKNNHIAHVFHTWWASKARKDQQTAAAFLLYRLRIWNDRVQFRDVEHNRKAPLANVHGRDPCNSLEVKIVNSVNLLKICSFADALLVIRFGNIDTLDSASVLSGSFNPGYRHNQYRRDILRESPESFGFRDHFDLLLLYIASRHSLSFLTSRGMSEDRVIATALEFLSVDTAVTTLRETRLLPRITKFTSALQQFLHNDRKEVATHLLFLQGLHLTRRNDNAGHSPLTTQMLSRTLRDIRPADLSSSLPLELLEIFHSPMPNGLMLKSFYDSCSYPKLLLEAMRTADLHLSSVISRAEERSVRARKYGEQASNAHYRTTVRRVTQLKRISQQLRYARRILDPGYEKGFEVVDASEAPSESVVVESFTRSPQGMPVQCRRRNRFTGVRYATLQDEIDGVTMWRRAQRKTLADIFRQYLRAVRRNGPDKGPKSRAALKRQYETNSLKQQTASKYLEALIKEASIGATARDQAKGSLFDSAKSSPLNYPKGADQLLPLEPLYAPYNVHHYVLGNILDQFKEAMYKFGWREFPEIMGSRGWNSPESIPVVEFMPVMTEDLDIGARYKFFAKEFNSLRYIRNAHAHSLGSLTLKKTRALLGDMRTVARALCFFEMVPLINQYLRLLASFEDSYRNAKAEWREKELIILRKWQEQREAAIKTLDKRIHRARDKSLNLESLKTTVHNDFDHRISESLPRWESTDRKIALQAAQELAAFALEEHIRRSLRAMSASRAGSLVRRLFAEHTSSATAKVDANTAEDMQTFQTNSAVPNVASSDIPTQGENLKISFVMSRSARRITNQLDASTPYSHQLDDDKNGTDWDHGDSPTSVEPEDGVSTVSRENVQSRDTNPALLGDVERSDAFRDDPSFDFLHNDDHQGPRQDSATNKPSKRLDNVEVDRKKARIIYHPPGFRTGGQAPRATDPATTRFQGAPGQVVSERLVPNVSNQRPQSSERPSLSTDLAGRRKLDWPHWPRSESEIGPKVGRKRSAVSKPRKDTKSEASIPRVSSKAAFRWSTEEHRTANGNVRRV